MIECEHLEHQEGLNFCKVASQFAGVSAPVTEAACKVCVGCPSPRSLNRVTVSIGLAKLVTHDKEAHQHKMAEALPYLVDVTATEAVKRYVQSTADWVAQGRPSRSDEEVKVILKICRSCDQWDQAASKCKLCGCQVNESNGWTNKARRVTEHCPEGKW